MLWNYIKIAFRNVIRGKGYSLINILGLAIGMAVCILVLVWTKYEFSYNKFHENIDELYWVCTWYHLGNQVDAAIGSPPAVGPALKEDYPEIVNTSRYLRLGGLMKYGEKIFREQVKMVDPGFLEMFTFPLLKGNSGTALDNPHSVVITEKTAEKYFGEEDPMGKILTYENKYDLTVTGVVKNIPDNSTIQFDFLAPIELARELYGETYIDTWYNCCFYTLAQVQKGADIAQINEKILGRIGQSEPDTNLESYLFPYKKINLYWISGKGGFIETLKMYLIIAGIVLAIAIINFVNLMTARSGKRAKEVAMRKVVGAYRTDLMKQFLGESIVMGLCAGVIAVVLAEIFLTTFRTIMRSSVTLDVFTDPVIPLGVTAIAVITGIIAGSYPGMLLSSFKPVKALKSTAESYTKRSWFRRILVVVQFSASVVLIICTLLIYQQHRFLQNKDLGYTKENIVYLPMYSKMQDNYDAVKNKLLQNPNIINVTKATHSPAGIYWNGEDWDWEGRDSNVNPLVTFMGVGYDFLETFDMEMAEGQFYSQETEGREDGLIINETFAKLMGSESAVGKRLSRYTTNYTIIGVVKDFHFKPVNRAIEPIIIYNNPDRKTWQLFARINSENTQKTVSYIEDVWKEFSPDFPFELTFLDDDYKNFYYREKVTGDTLKYFAIIAILLSCMGLFGLACFMAERRTKEIGVRKVLGATVTGIVQLLSKEFLILVVIANIIAIPIAYYLMKGWLENYPFRIEISAMLFVAVAALAILIAVVTVSFQAIKAALANPVDSLRYE